MARWAIAAQLFLLLAGLWSVRAEPLCNESTYAQYYFDRCLADAQCTYNFDLHSDEFAFFEYLLNTELLAPRSLNATAICVSSEAETLWLAELRVHQLCLPNQLRDPNLGCILRSDRTDDGQRKSHHRTSALGVLLVQVGILAIFLYTSFKLFREIDRLSGQTQAKAQASAPVVAETEVAGTLDRIQGIQVMFPEKKHK